MERGEATALAGEVTAGVRRDEATARAGVAGNPSDGYGGAVVAVPVPAFSAVVEVVDLPGREVRLRPPADELAWPSLDGLVSSVGLVGHEGSTRLVTAAIAQLAPLVRPGAATGGVEARAAAGASGPEVGAGGAGRRSRSGGRSGVEVSWTTTIPRSVGLAGSSALVIAVLRALSARWSVPLEPLPLATLALEAERSLGLRAGMQDRVVQAFGRPVAMDFGGGFGEAQVSVEVLSAPVPLSLFVAWSERAAFPSSGYQAAVRDRWETGDVEVRDALARLAGLAAEAASAIRRGSADDLAAVVGACAEQRRRLGPQSAGHEALMRAVEQVGLAATSAGSGGAVVGVLPSREGLAEVSAAVGALGGSAVEVPI